MGGELRRVDVARTRQIHAEFLLHPTRIRREQHHAVSEAGGLAHVVGHEHDRLLALLPDTLDVAVELLAREGVERGERLVHQQHLRVRRHGAGKRDALLHAAGELMNVRGAKALQSDQLQVVHRHLAPLGVLQPGLELQSEQQVVHHVEPREQRVFLEHHHPVSAGPAHRHAIGEDPARVGPLQPGDDVQQRRLAAARRANQADELALVHLQRHAIERMHHTFAGAEGLADFLDRQFRRGDRGEFLLERHDGKGIRAQGHRGGTSTGLTPCRKADQAAWTASAGPRPARRP